MTAQVGQKGSYDIQRGWWVLRYREKVIDAGQVKTILRAHRLGSLADFPPKRHKSSAKGADRASRLGVPNAIVAAGNLFLAQQNIQREKLKGLPKLCEFIETIFLPRIAAQRKPSTLKGYRDIYHDHLQERVRGVWLRDVIAADVQDWLYDIETNDKTKDGLTLTHRSLANIRNFLSAVFKLALREGYFATVNPVAGVAIPKGRESESTEYYDLHEARKIIAVLPRPASTAVACAAFAGLRRSEIRGLLWENYTDGSIRVTQSVWQSHIGTPKTAASQDAVPVIPELKRHLDEWHRACGEPKSGLVFPSSKDTPLDLNNLLCRVIAPTLKSAGLSWHGWHAFRRGLATNLHDAGVSDLTIQLVLRHSDVQTTRKSYIKRLPSQAVEAMKLVQSQLDKQPTAGSRLQ